jgi:DNA-binding transcriptional ArsR family regulator
MINETNQKAFKALGDPTRLHVIQFLSTRCCGCAPEDDEPESGPSASEVCCHITGAEKITSTVSHHLHELEEAGLITIQRKGKCMLCMLRSDTLQSLATELQKLAAGNAPCCGCC